MIFEYEFGDEPFKYEVSDSEIKEKICDILKREIQHSFTRRNKEEPVDDLKKGFDFAVNYFVCDLDFYDELFKQYEDELHEGFEEPAFLLYDSWRNEIF